MSVLRFTIRWEHWGRQGAWFCVAESEEEALRKFDEEHGWPKSSRWVTERFSLDPTDA